MLQDLASSLLQSLYRSPKSSPEFQVSLNQFYGSTEHKTSLSRLGAIELKKFVAFLDDVRQLFGLYYLNLAHKFFVQILRTKGLSGELLQQTRHNLQAVFDDWTVPPKSHQVHHKFSKLTTGPYAVSEYAQVWRGQFNSGKVNDHPTDACLKVIKIEKVHEVITNFRPSPGQHVG